MNTPKFGTTLFSTLALLSIGYAAFAQRQPTPPFKGAAIPKAQQKPQVKTPVVEQTGRRTGDFTCTMATDVLQLYLKLDKGQTAKIDPIVKRVRAGLVTLQTMGTTDPPKMGAQIKLLQDLFKSSDSDIDAILTSEQKGKMDAMFDEVRKLSSLGIDRDAIAQVKLTEKQKKELLALSDEYQKKRSEIKPEERPTEGRKLSGEYRDKASALLSDEQKATNAKVRENSKFTVKAKP